MVLAKESGVFLIIEYMMNSLQYIILPIHLPGEQPVYFANDATGEELEQQLETGYSELMAWFQYNTQDIDGHQYFYQGSPTYFGFLAKQQIWRKRQRGVAIGRMYHCNPLQDEQYYPSPLLTVVRGATPFENLRTISGTIGFGGQLYLQVGGCYAACLQQQLSLAMSLTYPYFGVFC